MCVDDTISATHLHPPTMNLVRYGINWLCLFLILMLVFLSVYCFYTVWFSMGLCHNLFGPIPLFGIFSLIPIPMDFKFLEDCLFPWIYQVLVPTYLIYSSPRNYAGRAEVRTWMIPPANDLVALPSFLVICNRKFFEPAKEGQRPHRSRDYLTTKAKSFACLPTYHRGPPSNSRSKFWQRHPCSDICCWLEACLSLEVDWF